MEAGPRPPGKPRGSPKSGGRKKGTPNRRTVARATVEKALQKAGITPLEFMLNLMHEKPGKDDPPHVKATLRALQLDAAKAAAPYVHARLASVELHGGKGADGIAKPLKVILSRDDQGVL